MEYEVKKGDGWYKIAKNLGVNVNELLQANNAKIDTMLQPGQKLKTGKSEQPIGVANTWGVNKAKDWSDQQLAKSKAQSEQAEKNATKDFKNRKNKIYQGQPDKTYQEMLSKDKIQALQQQLRSLGYDIGKSGADGIIGINTRKALAATEKAGYSLVNGKLIAPNKENYIKSNSPYALAHRALVGNIYPYDYNPDLSFDENNIAGYNEFLTLDLNTPEGMARAKEIRAMKQKDGKPLFSNRNIADNRELQRQFRERQDLLLLNSGRPQQFNSFQQYTDENGNTYYQFTNPDLNRRYAGTAQASRKAYTTDEKGNVIAYRDGVVDSEGNPVKYIPRDHTNTLFNQYMIQSRGDDFGNYTQVKDTWNLAPIENLPGSSIAPTIRIRSYDDYHIPTGSNPEDMIIENSVYDKHSVRLSDKEMPTKTEFKSPFSLNYFIENGKKYLKSKFND